MRFAITGLDWTIGVFRAFLDSGWEPAKLFAFPIKESLYSNGEIIELASSLKIPIQLSRMTAEDLEDLGRRGCDALIGAAYPWRIGDWRPHLRYAVNFHPSPLPDGRGPRPQIRAILEGRDAWGVSAHKFAPGIDEGDVLDRELFGLSPDECHESLNIKCQLAFDRLASRVARNIGSQWGSAVCQTGGSYWKRWTVEDQTTDLSRPIVDLSRHFRAFGLNGSIVRLNGARLLVTRAFVWKESHDYAPGTEVRAYGKNVVAAAEDGFVCLCEWTRL